MGKEQETSMELKNMVALVSRTGRHMQRYNILGHRQVVGSVSLSLSLSVSHIYLQNLENGVDSLQLHFLTIWSIILVQIGFY